MQNDEVPKDLKIDRISLPVITSVSIHGYPLYPGPNREGKPISEGLSRHIHPGVNVIAGINGQGKTTLLNILYRVLVGPWDQTKADYSNPGKKQHALTQNKRFDYFSARIGRSAEPFSVTLGLLIGSEKVEITRSLGPTMAIKKLTIRDRTYVLENPDEERWLDLVSELTGIKSHYDFHFLVRNFLFFLEDKIPLLWNPSGQFEILRILFLPTDLGSKCASIHDEILKLDSTYRNDHWQLTQFSERLDEFRAQIGADKNLADMIDNLSVTEARHQSLEEKAGELEKEISRQIQLLREVESTLFHAEIDLHDYKVEIETLQTEYFDRAFPDAEASAKLVFADLIANSKCNVCGQLHEPGKQRILRLLRDGQCPACESLLPESSVVVDVRQFDTERIKKMEAKVSEHKARVGKLLKNRDEIRDDLSELNDELLSTHRELYPLAAALRAARSAKEGTPGEIGLIEAEYKKLEIKNYNDREKLRKLREEYRAYLSSAASHIETVAQKVCDKFQHYADWYLREWAVLSYQMHERTVGQSGQKLEFPNFIVKIRSEVAAELKSRPDSFHVSESQREFVDLAFRMALLETVVEHHGAAMLAIETPEASLDAVFIERAGRMLRQFANSANENRLIATCNLNGEDMIRWLLGTAEMDSGAKLNEEVESRVINLLAEGMPTTGYLAEPEKYNAAYKKAVYGSKEIQII